MHNDRRARTIDPGVPLLLVHLEDAPVIIEHPRRLERVPEGLPEVVEIGLHLKQVSPFERHFTISLANGYNGYLPTPEHHALGGYETWRARSSYLEVEAAPKITTVIAPLTPNRLHAVYKVPPTSVESAPVIKLILSGRGRQFSCGIAM